VFVDLDADLAAPGSPDRGRHPLPEPEEFAAAMGRLGIGDDDTVVAYDDQGGVIAARLVWMLRVTGHDAALLDGGLAAWDGPLVSVADDGVGDAAPATFTPVPWPAEALATMDEAGDPRRIVLDARDGERYRGESEPVDPRAGHIPGAHNVPTRGGLGPDGRLLAPDALRERFAAAGVGEGDAPIAYCGSGVTACHLLLSLEHAGLGPGRLYPGSWSQWSASDRPAATGPNP
jgi:thiosulfate/3-mercaptopyruvate sulfurtransferase